MPALADIPASERAVLDALYTNTNGASWGNHTGWETATPVCDASLPAPSYSNWYGIVCDSTGSHVIGINFISGNGLNGPLPATLNQLQNLQGINIAGGGPGRLTGPIPSLAGLTSLQDIVLSNNQLSGSIPSFDGLTSLKLVGLTFNQLSGSIPALSGVGLTALQTFDVSYNQLSGSIPPLNGLTALQTFDVSDNQLSGSIPALSGVGLTALQGFDVSDNQLSGSLPSLAGLTALQTFNAGTNQLSGSVPSLDGLTSLGIFAVDNNQLTGVPPDTFPGTYSRLCPNYLSLSPDATVNANWTATTFPAAANWHDACTTTVTGTVSATDTRITTQPTLTLTCSPSTPVAVAGTPGSWQVQMSQAGSNCTLGVAGTPPTGYSYVVTYGPSAEINTSSGNFSVAGTAADITDLKATVTLKAGGPPPTTSASSVPTLSETALALLAALLGLSALAAQRRRAR